MLQAQRDRDGKTVHQAPERCSLLVHVQEDLAECAVGILPGPKIDLVAADDRLLGVPTPPFRQAASSREVAEHDSRRLPLGRCQDFPAFRYLARIRGGIQRLAELRPIPVQRYRLHHAVPGQQIRGLHIVDRGTRRHIDRFTYGS